MLNRYSYCLNNPLKYIDPSGRVVDFLYFDEIQWCIQYGWNLHQEWVDTFLTSYDAYTEFKSRNKDNADLASQMENSPEHFNAYLSGQNLTFTNQRAGTEGASFAYNIYSLPFFEYIMFTYDLPTNVIDYSLTGTETLVVWGTIEVYTGSVLVPSLILLCDTVSFVADLSPAGYPVSAFTGTVSWRLTDYEYRHGRATVQDVDTAFVTWSTGFIPYIGAIPAGYQLLYDVGVVPSLPR